MEESEVATTNVELLLEEDPGIAGLYFACTRILEMGTELIRTFRFSLNLEKGCDVSLNF